MCREHIDLDRPPHRRDGKVEPGRPVSGKIDRELADEGTNAGRTQGITKDGLVVRLGGIAIEATVELALF